MQGKLRETHKLLTTRNGGKEKMRKKYFAGVLMGVGLGILASAEIVQAETSMTDAPKGQGLKKAERAPVLQPLESLTMMNAYMKRRDVSINWQEVIATVGIFSQPVGGPTDSDKLRTASEAIQQFSDELRSRLQGFEDRYNVRVAWRGSDKDCLDVTQEFLKYLQTEQATKDSCQINRIEEYKQGLMKIVGLSDELKGKKEPK